MGAQNRMQHTRFGQIISNISDARVYGGIHSRTDQDVGTVLGNAVAAEVFKTPAFGARERLEVDDVETDFRGGSWFILSTMY